MCRLFRMVCLMALVTLVLPKAYSSSEEGEEAHVDWLVLKAQKPAKASLVPKDLLDRLKSQISKDELEKNFVSAEVYLFDDHQVIEHPVKVVTPAGGGTVDLENLLPKGKAKFSIRMRVTDSSDHEVVPDHVYFVPKVSYVENGVEKNCGHYFDVTDFYRSTLSPKKGFETYLTEGIYAGVLLGSYVFVKTDKEAKKVFLSHVNIVDSRNNKNACTF